MNEGRPDITLMLPPDPWWPRRVRVANDGDCVPFHIMLLWHYQFLTPRNFIA